MNDTLIALDILSLAKEIAPIRRQAKSSKGYYLSENIGRSRYVVNFHDGVKTHKDGSPFYDIEVFSNKKNAEGFMKDLVRKGYKEGRP